MLSAKEEFSIFAKRIIDFFEDGEFYSAAKASVFNLENCIEEHDKFLQEFEESIRTKKEVEEINNIASSAYEKIINVVNCINNERTSLKAICDKGIEFLKHRKKSINRFLEVLEEGGINVIVLSKPFTDIIELATQNIEEMKNGADITYHWKEILENLESLTSKLYEEVKNILTKDQFAILLIIVEASSKNEWFEQSSLIKVLTKKLDKTATEIETTLNYLVKAKLLKEGISLPI